MKYDYIYHGDKLAKLQSPFAGKPCKAVRRLNGKCIRGKNSNMLVLFPGGFQVVVLARMLRKFDSRKYQKLLNTDPIFFD